MTYVSRYCPHCCFFICDKGETGEGSGEPTQSPGKGRKLTCLLGFQWLYGYDNFPYDSIDVNIVGWAVRDTGLLQGSTEGIDVYTNTDSEGAPQCAPECGRFFHQVSHPD